MVPWSWFSFGIGVGAILLLELIAFVVGFIWLSVKAARPPKTHPLFKKE